MQWRGTVCHLQTMRLFSRVKTNNETSWCFSVFSTMYFSNLFYLVLRLQAQAHMQALWSRAPDSFAGSRLEQNHVVSSEEESKGLQWPTTNSMLYGQASCSTAAGEIVDEVRSCWRENSWAAAQQGHGVRKVKPSTGTSANKPHSPEPALNQTVAMFFNLFSLGPPSPCEAAASDMGRCHAPLWDLSVHQRCCEQRMPENTVTVIGLLQGELFSKSKLHFGRLFGHPWPPAVVKCQNCHGQREHVQGYYWSSTK